MYQGPELVSWYSLPMSVFDYEFGRVEALRSLLQANADPNITSDRGVLPIQELFLHPHMKHNEEDVRQVQFIR